MHGRGDHRDRGSAGPGEILVRVRGGSETFLAWSDDPLPTGARVLVIESRGRRAVHVIEWADPLTRWAATPSAQSEEQDMFGYRVPAPDEAMLISGGRRGLGARRSEW